MTVCTAPGCRKTAVLQWLRAASDDETSAARNAAQHQQATMASRALHVARLNLVEKRDQVDRVEARASKGDRDAAELLHLLRLQLAAAQAKVDNAPPTPVIPLDTVRIAVFGCRDHAIDPDAATGLHEPHCLTDSTCTCDPTPLAQEEPTHG